MRTETRPRISKNTGSVNQTDNPVWLTNFQFGFTGFVVVFGFGFFCPPLSCTCGFKTSNHCHCQTSSNCRINCQWFLTATYAATIVVLVSSLFKVLRQPPLMKFLVRSQSIFFLPFMQAQSSNCDTEVSSKNCE